MSGHNGGGRGRGGAEYLRDLNALLVDDGKFVDTFDPDDLALYTNTEFYEFAIGEGDGIGESRDFVAHDATQLKDDRLEFLNDADPFDYMHFSLPDTAEDRGATIQIPSTATASEFNNSTATMSPPSEHQPSVTQSSSESAFTPPTIASRARNGKRKTSVVATSPSADDLDDISRFAAEEDKRRRNTAASARFRIKKKQREQALERTAKDLTDRVTELQSKVSQLEMENKWLKNLIVGRDSSGPTPTESEASSRDTPSLVDSRRDVGTRKRKS